MTESMMTRYCTGSFKECRYKLRRPQMEFRQSFPRIPGATGFYGTSKNRAIPGWSMPKVKK